MAANGYFRVVSFITLLRLVWCEPCSLLEGVSAQIERTISGTGLHREVHTQVWLSGLGEVGACRVMLQETLPTGAYVDPDQLERLRGMGLVPDFQMGGPVDIEVGEWLSAPITILLHPEMGFDREQLFLNYTFPLHARYHKARSGQDSERARVSIAHPTVWLTCPTLTGSCLSTTTAFPCPPGGCSDRTSDGLSVTSDGLSGTSVGCNRHSRTCRKESNAVGSATRAECDRDTRYEEESARDVDNSKCSEKDEEILQTNGNEEAKSEKEAKWSVETKPDEMKLNGDSKSETIKASEDAKTEEMKSNGETRSKKAKGSSETNPDETKSKPIPSRDPIPSRRDRIPGSPLSEIRMTRRLPSIGWFFAPFSETIDQSNFDNFPTCFWLPVQSFSTTEGVHLSIPVGRLESRPLALLITGLLTGGGALLLLSRLKTAHKIP